MLTRWNVKLHDDESFKFEMSNEIMVHMRNNCCTSFKINLKSRLVQSFSRSVASEALGNLSPLDGKVFTFKLRFWKGKNNLWAKLWIKSHQKIVVLKSNCIHVILDILKNEISKRSCGGSQLACPLADTTFRIAFPYAIRFLCQCWTLRVQ